MLRVAAALLLTLVASISAGAAGHDVSPVLTAPTNATDRIRAYGPDVITPDGAKLFTPQSESLEKPF